LKPKKSSYGEVVGAATKEVEGRFEVEVEAVVKVADEADLLLVDRVEIEATEVLAEEDDANEDILVDKDSSRLDEDFVLVGVAVVDLAVRVLNEDVLVDEDSSRLDEDFFFVGVAVVDFAVRVLDEVGFLVTDVLVGLPLGVDLVVKDGSTVVLVDLVLLVVDVQVADLEVAFFSAFLSTLEFSSSSVSKSDRGTTGMMSAGSSVSSGASSMAAAAEDSMATTWGSFGELRLWPPSRPRASNSAFC
jgi:hypothetical protein